jgi:hypothetical protein
VETALGVGLLHFEQFQLTPGSFKNHGIIFNLVDEEPISGKMAFPAARVAAVRRNPGLWD